MTTDPPRPESAARGREARRRVSRSAQATWRPHSDRSDPLDLLEEQAATRLADLIPVRYGRMLASPYGFYRGAALIMAADLASQPHTGLTVQLCGDAHLGNFGFFASPERQLMFDITDFDETLPGPWEWDVKRLVASFEIGGREQGFGAAELRTIVAAAVREYREYMRRAAAMPVLEVWYAHLTSVEINELIATEVQRGRLSRRGARNLLADIEKARRRDSARVLSRRAREQDGELRFIPQPPLLVPIEDLVPPGSDREQNQQATLRQVRAYRRSLAKDHHPIEEFRYLHMARQVVGVGSVGMRIWLFLMVGRDDRDPLILQAKEAQASVLERFLGATRFDNHGRRVVAGQRLIQAASDIFLGWVRVPDFDGEPRDYYVRQFHNWKGSLDITTMRVPDAILYAELCGAALARSHARSGDRVAIASYLGKGDGFDRAMTTFAAAYADQNQRDYEELRRAVAAGRIQAAPLG